MGSESTQSSVTYPAPPNNDYPIATSSNYHRIPATTSYFFYWLILTIAVLAIIGNVLAIRSIKDRKIKFLQKTCILALAISDILSVIFFSINMLDTLSKEYLTWTLGEFLCYFIPFAQVLTTTASSLILMVIAVDRYQSIVQSFRKNKWNPRPLTCIFFIILIFVICGVLAYPMYTVFNYEGVWTLTLPLTEKTTWQLCFLCFATKDSLHNYYIALDTIIFLPMLTVFVWFYIKIAILIWKHRKPITSKFNKLENKEMEDPSSDTTKTTNVYSITDASTPKPKKQRNLQVERKIRTFRIVLVLITAFVLCRFPYWCYYSLRLLGLYTSNTSWDIHFTLVSFNMFNCVLNPLLYTFLNQTVTAIRIIRDFLWKVCCFCCSNDEFEEFEKTNPFSRDRVQMGCGTVQSRPYAEKALFGNENEKAVKKY